jgi:hypothetical protein
MFGEVDIFVLAARSSDDCPLFITYGEQRVEIVGSSEKFKFEVQISTCIFLKLKSIIPFITINLNVEKLFSNKGFNPSLLKNNSSNLNLLICNSYCFGSFWCMG